MSPAHTHAIITDVLTIAAMALGLAVVIYSVVRVRTGLNWSGDGNVLARPYNAVDGLVALLIMSVFGWLVMAAPSGSTPKPENMNVYAFGLFIGALFPVVLCLILFAYMKMLRRMDPKEMFGIRSVPVTRAFKLGFVWYLGALLFMAVTTFLVYTFLLDGKMPDDSKQELVRLFHESDNIFLRGVIMLAAMVLAPITEEVLFRGFFYGVTKRYTERWFAILFTSMMFAAVHNHVGSLLPLFLLGIGFAVAYEATGSLLVPIFMHLFFNTMGIVQLWLLKAPQ